MKLVPAPGSPEMQAALLHTYVRQIVDILFQDAGLLRPVAKLLQKHFSPDSTGLEKDLEALIENQSRPDETGNVLPPSHVIQLTQILRGFYRQSGQKISYQRGAILELLAQRFVCPRYQQEESCLGNQVFVDQGKRITIKQVDVAALSHNRMQLEGYACKIKVNSIESSDCTDLAYLSDAAQERGYRANVGVISFDNDAVVRIKLTLLDPLKHLKAYGLESIEKLKDSPF